MALYKYSGSSDKFYSVLGFTAQTGNVYDLNPDTTIPGDGNWVAVATVATSSNGSDYRNSVVVEATGIASADTANLQNAFNTGKDVYITPGLYAVNAGLTLAESGQRVYSTGDNCLIQAQSAMSAILTITSTGGGRGVFEGLKFDGNSLATNCVIQNCSPENSIGTRWVRCKFRGATGFQMVNNGCEDVTYFDCSTDGNEGSPSTIPHALQVVVPNGMVRIIGGEWFGRCDLNYQQVSVYGAVIGPIFVNNPSSVTASILKIDGCYVYDGGVDNDNCINTGTNLSNINITASYLIAASQKNFINGNMPNVTVRAQDCIFIQTAALGANPVSYVLQASGAGKIVIDGGNSGLVSGGVLHAFNPVASATTTTTTLVSCIGLT